MTRRDLGWVAAKVFAVAGGSEFFASWLRAAEMAHAHGGNSAAPPEPDRWKNYRPKFFSAAEFSMLDIYTDILIPSDDTPGARAAHVAPYIDYLVNAAAEYAPEMQSHWRGAMGWLTSKNFQQLSREQQLDLIRQSSGPEHNHAIHHEGYASYRLIKDAAVHAFFTSRVGLIDVLEYKGLAYLTTFPACEHPEHRKA
jgi:hypothetical protein